MLIAKLESIMSAAAVDSTAIGGIYHNTAPMSYSKTMSAGAAASGNKSELGDEHKGLTAISAYQSALQVVKGIQDPDIKRRTETAKLAAAKTDSKRGFQPVPTA